MRWIPLSLNELNFHLNNESLKSLRSDKSFVELRSDVQRKQDFVKKCIKNIFNKFNKPLLEVESKVNKIL
jgi:hypothetical protein